MYPTGIEQPCNPVFQRGHHENLSDLDAGDWVPSSDATMSDRFPSSGQCTSSKHMAPFELFSKRHFSAHAFSSLACQSQVLYFPLRQGSGFDH